MSRLRCVRRRRSPASADCDRRAAGGRPRRSGSVLMEYLIVNLAVAVPLLILWHEGIFNASEGKWTGYLGLGIQAMYQRVMSGIALPIP